VAQREQQVGELVLVLEPGEGGAERGIADRAEG